MENKKDGVLDLIHKLNEDSSRDNDENTDKYIEAYFNPALREDYKKYLPDLDNLTTSSAISPALLIGDGDYFVQSHKQFYMRSKIRVGYLTYTTFRHKQIVQLYAKIPISESYRSLIQFQANS